MAVERATHMKGLPIVVEHGSSVSVHLRKINPTLFGLYDNIVDCDSNMIMMPLINQGSRNNSFIEI